jgi:hypothetical protein
VRRSSTTAVAPTAWRRRWLSPKDERVGSWRRKRKRRRQRRRKRRRKRRMGRWPMRIEGGIELHQRFP